MKLFQIRHLIVALALLGLTSLAVSRAPIAHAALPAPTTIAVADGIVGIDGADGKCSLIEAIQNANNNAATNTDCTAGAGDDTITLAPNSTYTLTASNNTIDGANGLPVIVSATTAGKLTIEGSGATITRSGTTAFRFLDLATGANLTVNQTTLNNGSTPTGIANSATVRGGAIYANAGSTLTLTNCTVSNNTAADDAGALALISTSGSPSTVSITKCVFSSNTAADDGGAILAGATSTSNLNFTVSSSTFTGNSATGASGDGGAINTFGAILTITNSLFQNNTVAHTGGALFLQPQGNSDSISGSTFTGNSSTDDLTGGGAINLQSGTHTITNSTISGNTANNNGGGIRTTASSNTTLNFVTVASNTADNNNNGSGDGGGIVNAATFNLKNSIVADNADRGNQAPNIVGTITSANYNHVESTTGGTFSASTGDMIGSDPALLPLANNGGKYRTQEPAIGSLVLDTIPNGTNGCGTSPFDFDQRGAARPSDSNLDTTAACDKGAVEAGPSLCAIQDADEPLSFAPLTDFEISVTDDGTNLDCLRAAKIFGAPANAQATMDTGSYWRISAFQSDKVTAVTNDFSAKLTLPFGSGGTEDEICRYQETDDTWSCQTAEVTPSGNLAVTVHEFSTWAVNNKPTSPTAASLISFNAKAAKNVVKLNWETGTEISVLGFNVYRKQNAGKKAQAKGIANGEWVQVNDALLQANHPGEIQGDTYTLTDNNVKPSKKYQYKLEIVHADGFSEWSDVEVVKLKKNK